jgi:phosphoribosylglycinamide formyltransferase-1
LSEWPPAILGHGIIKIYAAKNFGLGITTMRIRLAVLCSGGGRTLQNFIDKASDGTLHAELVRVISSSPQAPALARAEQADIPFTVIPPNPAQKASLEIFDLMRRERVDLVALAGYVHFLPIPDDFLGRVMNIHPSLIPSFSGKGYYGLKVHEAALKRGVKVSGCTVHFADNEYDHGPIIIQRCVPVLPNDTPTTLQERVFAAECEAYPDAINQFARDLKAKRGTS